MAAEKIGQGRFQSVSEVVRAGLRKLEEDEIKLQALREKLHASEESPVVENFETESCINEIHE